jgi:hypothetical protein
MDILNKRSLLFLILQGSLFLFFYLVNMFFMKIHRDWWKGISSCFIFIDAFYYTTATHTSIGFGDITPNNEVIRILSSIHMLCVFALIILQF